MVAAFKNQNAITVNLWNNLLSPEKRKDLDQLFGNKNRKDSEPLEGEIDIKYNVVGNGCHFGEISTLDTCLQRPIFATCSIKD